MELGRGVTFGRPKVRASQRMRLAVLTLVLRWLVIPEGKSINE